MAPISTNRNPHLGCAEEGNYSVQNSSVLIFWYCTALRLTLGLGPCLSGLTALLFFGLLCIVTGSLRCLSSARKMQSSVLVEKESVLWELARNWFVETEVPTLCAWLAGSYADQDSKFLQFAWSRRHCTNWSEWSHSDWSVKKLMRM